jgi:hypothetical protein
MFGYFHDEQRVYLVMELAGDRLLGVSEPLPLQTSPLAGNDFLALRRSQRKASCTTSSRRCLATSKLRL